MSKEELTPKRPVAPIDYTKDLKPKMGLVYAKEREGLSHLEFCLPLFVHLQSLIIPEHGYWYADQGNDEN
jgi:hypothetical protein